MSLFGLMQAGNYLVQSKALAYYLLDSKEGVDLSAIKKDLNLTPFEAKRLWRMHPDIFRWPEQETQTTLWLAPRTKASETAYADLERTIDADAISIGIKAEKQSWFGLAAVAIMLMVFLVAFIVGIIFHSDSPKTHDASGGHPVGGIVVDHPSSPPTAPPVIVIQSPPLGPKSASPGYPTSAPAPAAVLPPAPSFPASTQQSQSSGVLGAIISGGRCIVRCAYLVLPLAVLIGIILGLACVDEIKSLGRAERFAGKSKADPYWAAGTAPG